MVVLLPSYALLMWILSSGVTQRWGLEVFLCGLAALAPALFAFHRGRRWVFYGLFLIVFTGAATCLAFETLLRLTPGVLSGHVANKAYHGYHWCSGGIYMFNERRGYDMRPNVRRHVYWAGHWWLHEANADGYRGPAVARAEAVFLGDSMVYGHGVEQKDALAARFGSQTGCSVANLGQQATCQIQSWMRLQLLGVRLRPGVVFACVHPGDVEDATHWYEPSDLERFVSSPTGQPYELFARAEYHPRPWHDFSAYWAQRVALPMRCAGAWTGLPEALHTALKPSTGTPRQWTVPTANDIEKPFRHALPNATYEEDLGWRCQIRALREIKSVCDAMGARLIVFDLGYPKAFTEAVEKAAREVGAEYSTAGRVALARSLQGEPVYLPNDGHWTGRGSAVVAAELARAIKPRPSR